MGCGLLHRRYIFRSSGQTRRQVHLRSVCFEARPKDIKRFDVEWDWDENPFKGANKQGLKVLIVLLNNWDLKNSNHRMLPVKGRNRGGSELRYVVSDLGVAFGKTGNSITIIATLPTNTSRQSTLRTLMAAHRLWF